MSKKERYLAEAERLYIHAQKTLREIAVLTGVSERTLGLWKKEGAWDKQRLLAQASSLGTVEQIHNQIVRVIEMMKDADDPGRYADQLSKLIAASNKIERAGGDLATQTVVVFEKFAVYVRDKSPEREKIEWLEQQITGFMRAVMGKHV